MKKLQTCVLFASPHKNGATAQLLATFENSLDIECTITHFDLYEKSCRPCIDCGFCKKHEACAFNDMNDIYQAIEQCDLLIIASPVYCMSFPAPLKAVLDRFQRYYNARMSLGKRPPIEKHRLAVLLAAAGSEEENADIASSQLRRCFSVMNTRIEAVIVHNGLDNNKLLDADMVKKTAQHISRVLRS